MSYVKPWLDKAKNRRAVARYVLDVCPHVIWTRQLEIRFFAALEAINPMLDLFADEIDEVIVSMGLA